MIDVGYANAFCEVLKILEYININDYEKIPSSLIRTFRMYANYDYDFKYDVNKTLEEQQISDIAKAIIANIFKEYWATPYQKERIEEKEKNDRQKIEEEKRELYNPDNLFEKKKQIINTELENTQMIVYEENNFFKKIINKIMKIFKR